MTKCCGYWCKWKKNKDIRLIVSVCLYIPNAIARKAKITMLLALNCHWTVLFWRRLPCTKMKKDSVVCLNVPQWPFIITSQRQRKFANKVETGGVASVMQVSLSLTSSSIVFPAQLALCFPEPPRSTCSDTSFEASLHCHTEGTWVHATPAASAIWKNHTIYICTEYFWSQKECRGVWNQSSVISSLPLNILIIEISLSHK